LPAEGAKTIIYLASSPDVITGQYFYKCFPITPSAAARDNRSALLLWQHNGVLAGLRKNGSSPPWLQGPRRVGAPFSGDADLSGIVFVKPACSSAFVF
jgi:hypothetical protein